MTADDVERAQRVRDRLMSAVPHVGRELEVGFAGEDAAGSGLHGSAGREPGAQGSGRSHEADSGVERSPEQPR